MKQVLQWIALGFQGVGIVLLVAAVLEQLTALRLQKVYQRVTADQPLTLIEQFDWLRQTSLKSMRANLAMFRAVAIMLIGMALYRAVPFLSSLLAP